MTIQTRIRWLTGAAFATLALALSGTRGPAHASITDDCPGGTLACADAKVCIGEFVSVCTTKHHYMKPSYGGSGYEAV